MSNEQTPETAPQEESQKATETGQDQKANKKGKKSRKVDQLADLQEEVEELKIQLQEQKDKFLRLYAEFDNFKRRTAKERLDLIRTAGQDIISELLPVLDDFDRAEKSLHDTQDFQTATEGFLLIREKLFKRLEAKGLKLMDSQGKDFDPDLHEAITEIPAPKDDLKGKVVDVIEKGYQLGDKIIRYAKVVVGK